MVQCSIQCKLPKNSRLLLDAWCNIFQITFATSYFLNIIFAICIFNRTYFYTFCIPRLPSTAHIIILSSPTKAPFPLPYQNLQTLNSHKPAMCADDLDCTPLDRLSIGTHHKTGGYTFRFLDDFKKVCKDTKMKWRWRNNMNGISLYQNEISEWTVKRLLPRINLEDPFTFLHVVRHPLETVISAYHYHKQGIEDWTKDPFPTSFNFQWCFEDVMASCTLPYCASLQSQKRSLMQIFSDFSLQHGLHFSYMLFKFCRFPKWKAVDLLLHNISISNPTISYHLVHFELWHHAESTEDFQQGLEKYLTYIGIDSSNKLWCDLLDIMKSRRLINGNAHSTMGTYDLEAEKNLLLSIPEVCEDIQKFSMQFDYHWNYGNHC